MKITVAQLNPTVGDLNGNFEKLRRALESVPAGAADLLVTPELFLCGYPPRDLLALDWFLERLESFNVKVAELSASRPDMGILVGTARRHNHPSGKKLYNSGMLFENGKLLFTQDKQLLPTYDVFDEVRYFDEGTAQGVVEFHGVKLGISICEDAWNDEEFEKTHRYNLNPVASLAEAGAELMVNLSASPYHRGKERNRFARFAFHARKWKTPFIFAGQVGANDELIFDGQSFAVDSEGRLIAALSPFEEEVRIIDTSVDGSPGASPGFDNDIEAVRSALVLGVRDYLRKTGFSSAVLGLSGGIDSAVTACIAAEALGAENVRGITMPSHYSSSGSVDDSLALAANLGMRCDMIPIKDIFDTFVAALEDTFAGLERDVTEENLQARIRGTLLMAYSNKFGSILLSTGNKSELAVGYCTLYGDMNGGLAVISDLPKSAVYELARLYNRDSEVIPEAILTKPPSAELAPGQTDQDTLPPYDILDDILERYLERLESPEEIIASGHDDETVRWVVNAVNRNEYKRKQAAPGLRVTTKAFGSGRRMPIAARWE